MPYNTYTDPGIAGMGLALQDQFQRQQLENAQTLQQIHRGQQEMDQSAVMDPLRLQQVQTDIQTAQARLPGIQAQSQAAQREQRKAGLLEGLDIEQAIGKYGAEKIAQKSKMMEDFGTTLIQGAGQVASFPMGSAQRLRTQFDEMGMGKMWNPAWDKMSPGELAMSMSEYGKELQGSGLKLRQATELQESKNSSAEDRARMAYEARLAAIEASNQRAATSNQARGSGGKKTPLDFQKQSVAYANAAIEAEEAGDSAGAQRYNQLAQQFQTAAMQLRQAGAMVPKAGDLDLGSVADLPTNKPDVKPLEVVKPKAGTRENPIKLD